MKQCFVVLFVLVQLGLASETSRLIFRKENRASVVYSNNPEQVFETELCDKDKGRVSVLSQDVTIPGNFRHFWEFENQNDCEMGWAIVISNLDLVSNISIKLLGSGHCEEWTCGGKAIADMLNSEQQQLQERKQIVSIPPGKDYIVFFVNSSVQKGNIETGMIDMIVNGNQNTRANFRHLLFCDFEKCDIRAPGQNYISRKEPDGENEAGVYKGLMPFSHAIADQIALSITKNSTPGTIISVSYPRLNATTGNWTEFSTPYFITNIISKKVYEAVASDLSPMIVPGWGKMDPNMCCDARGMFPNMDNWAIEYQVTGKITNFDHTDHTLTFHFEYTECDSAIAYQQGGENSKWKGVYMTKGCDPVVYVYQKVPSGSTVSFSGKWMLGGPSCGGEKHFITIH